MKTNREKACSEISDEFTKTNDAREIIKIPFYRVASALVLASEPDWYHPSKGEFPDENGRYLTIQNHVNKDMCYILGWDNIYNEHSKEYWQKYVISWTYLPKYKENGK